MAKSKTIKRAVEVTLLEKKSIKFYTLPTTAGAVFTRWGRTVCPDDASLVYKGESLFITMLPWDKIVGYKIPIQERVSPSPMCLFITGSPYNILSIYV